MSLIFALLPLSAAAFTPRMPASRAVVAPRASRPAMLVGAELVQPELADAVLSGSTQLLGAVLEKDGSYSSTLSESISALSPNGQAVTYGTYLIVILAAVQIVRVALPEVLKIGFVIAIIELFGGIIPPL